MQRREAPPWAGKDKYPRHRIDPERVLPNLGVNLWIGISSQDYSSLTDLAYGEDMVMPCTLPVQPNQLFYFKEAAAESKQSQDSDKPPIQVMVIERIDPNRIKIEKIRPT